MRTHIYAHWAIQYKLYRKHVRHFTFIIKLLLVNCKLPNCKVTRVIINRDWYGLTRGLGCIKLSFPSPPPPGGELKQAVGEEGKGKGKGKWVEKWEGGEVRGNFIQYTPLQEGREVIFAGDLFITSLVCHTKHSFEGLSEMFSSFQNYYRKNAKCLMFYL